MISSQLSPKRISSSRANLLRTMPKRPDLKAIGFHAMKDSDAPRRDHPVRHLAANQGSLFLPTQSLQPNPYQQRQHIHDKSLQDLTASLREKSVLENIKAECRTANIGSKSQPSQVLRMGSSEEIEAARRRTKTVRCALFAICGSRRIAPRIAKKLPLPSPFQRSAIPGVRRVAKREPPEPRRATPQERA